MPVEPITTGAAVGKAIVAAVTAKQAAGAAIGSTLAMWPFMMLRKTDQGEETRKWNWHRILEILPLIVMSWAILSKVTTVMNDVDALKKDTASMVAQHHELERKTAQLEQDLAIIRALRAAEEAQDAQRRYPLRVPGGR